MKMTMLQWDFLDLVFSKELVPVKMLIDKRVAERCILKGWVEEVDGFLRVTNLGAKEAKEQITELGQSKETYRGW